MNEERIYDASTIAKWFLFYNDVQMNESDADLISNLKLQKLLYYAQGCFLAIKGTPLFHEKILAWDHGPVVNEIYQKYKSNGARGIDYKGDYDNSIDPDDETLLRQVYEIFGQYSAWGLRNKTHEESPWKDTPRNHEISNESIRDYFLENYVE